MSEEYRRKWRQRPHVKAKQRVKNAEHWAALKSDPVKFKERTDALREYESRPEVYQRRRAAARAKWEAVKADPAKMAEYRKKGIHYHKAYYKRKRKKIRDTLAAAIANPLILNWFVEELKKWRAAQGRRKSRFTPEEKKRRQREIHRRLNDEYRARLNADPVKREAYRARRLESIRKYMATPKGIARLKARRSDPILRLVDIVRNRVRRAMKSAGGKTRAKYDYLFGCTFAELKTHIESLWKPGMHWQNHGRGEGRWHVDHVKPLAAFRLIEPSERRKAFHYTNLAPAWGEENLTKSSKWNNRHWRHRDHLPTPGSVVAGSPGGVVAAGS